MKTRLWVNKYIIFRLNAQFMAYVRRSSLADTYGKVGAKPEMIPIVKLITLLHRRQIVVNIAL